jgi:hypothetical protein
MPFFLLCFQSFSNIIVLECYREVEHSRIVFPLTHPAIRRAIVKNNVNSGIYLYNPHRHLSRHSSDPLYLGNCDDSPSSPDAHQITNNSFMSSETATCPKQRTRIFDVNIQILPVSHHKRAPCIVTAEQL